jgi:hypothetical protein
VPRDDRIPILTGFSAVVIISPEGMAGTRIERTAEPQPERCLDGDGDGCRGIAMRREVERRTNE